VNQFAFYKKFLRIKSAGAAVGFCHAFESFFYVLAAARPGGFFADITGDF
jgi:hypothetical protein